MTPFIAPLLGAAVPMPSPDPLGYPAAPALMQALAYLTLTLHFLAMMFTVGGAMLILVAYLRGDRSTQRFFVTALPLGFSYLVTFGIPPLLFVQVLYGQLFYTSSVLVGVFWILVVPLLIAAYGALYWHRFARDAHPRRWLAVLIALAAMLCIAFIYVNNLTLLQTPEAWLSKYAAHPGGATLNTAEPTHGPRYAFFMLHTLIVAGAALVLRGAYLRRWGHEDAGRSSARQGAIAMLIGLCGASAAAGGVLAAMPAGVRAFVFGNALPLGLLVAGVIFDVAAAALGAIASRRSGLAAAYGAAVAVTGALACLVVLRDQVRGAYLEPYFSLSGVPVHAQWGMLAIFGTSLAAGLALVIALLWKIAPALAAGRRKTT